jgi:hypothetical protein
MWRLFVLFSRIYPHLTKQCSLCFLFLPSLLYWGGGIMRDTICIAASGWLFSSFYYFFVSGKRKWADLVILLISFYILYHVKAYIAIVISIVLIPWLVVLLISNVKNTSSRKLLVAGILTLALIFIGVFLKDISGFINDKIFSAITDTIVEAQKNYEMVSTGTDATLANFDDIQPTFTSIFSKIPIALNNALFRPYIWESAKPNIILSAIENTAILLFTLFTIFSRGPVVFFRKLFSNQLLAVSFLFSLLFAIMIGLTCFNSGSMVRYKIPCLPFFCVSMALIYYPSGVKKPH